MAVDQRFDWRAAAESALVALAVALPPVWVVTVLKARDVPGQESNLWLVVPIALLGGFGVGGYAAGRRVPSTPLMHAAGAGAIAFGTLFVISVTRRVLGDGVSLVHIVRLLLLAQVCVSCALLGGYVATRRSHRA